MKTHSIQISSELLRLFSDIDEFKGAWRALGSLAPDRLRALRHVATIESVGSSTRIEGSKLSDREVEKLLLAVDVQQPDSRDEQEVAGYAQTIEMIFQASSNYIGICCAIAKRMSAIAGNTKRSPIQSLHLITAVKWLEFY